MGKKKKILEPGRGRLLDAWSPPDGAGQPIGCIATTFTFNPALFEEECLSRFAGIESDAAEDGASYLLEREEKLSQLSCAAVVVDRHHCKGERSLRWDLLLARVPGAIMHAKLSLLYWQKVVRVIVGSANLTDDGYRRNQEIFGILDFRDGAEIARSVFDETVEYLSEIIGLTGEAGDKHPAITRCLSLISRVKEAVGRWNIDEKAAHRGSVRVAPIFVGNDRPSLLATMERLWPPNVGRPDEAEILSPFFDREGPVDRPTRELWGILKQRGEASASFVVEGIDAGDTLEVSAPRSILHSEPPGRTRLTTTVSRALLEDSRPLHAKMMEIRNSQYSLVVIGSSNFTSAGLGLRRPSNIEANLAYLLDLRDKQALDAFNASTLDREELDPEEIRFQPVPAEDGLDAEDELLLPAKFESAVFSQSGGAQTLTLHLSDAQTEPGWQVVSEEAGYILNESEWTSSGSPSEYIVAWSLPRPPSGLWVSFPERDQLAWWPVNVRDASALPPSDELRSLPLEVLIEILSSALPLHRVLALQNRKRNGEKNAGECEIDPHKRVDTTSFLLQRTRRVSRALSALRSRLERPVVSEEALAWRLRGPVGVLALVQAIRREAMSGPEEAFLVAEILLELSKVCPQSVPGCLPPERVSAAMRALMAELKGMIADTKTENVENLSQYLDALYEAVRL